MPMTPTQAVVAFTQSEKIKAGLIWITQAIERSAALSAAEKNGAAATVRVLMEMLYYDIHLAEKLSKDESWRDTEKHLDMAILMIDSNVLHEATFHLTRALSRVTGIGQRSMSVLKKNGLL